MGQTILVCGGRDYTDKSRVYGVLTLLHEITPIEYIVHGCAKGADELADKWARENGIAVEKYPALWDVHGRGAGPIRNQLMVDDAKPDMVLAFPGGRGTTDMVRRAKSVGIRVVEIER